MLTVQFLIVLDIQAVPTGFEEYLHVKAMIDGSDWFEMQENLWRWQHRNYEIPETFYDIDKTIVNGQEFLSEWPNGEDYLDYSAYNEVLGLPTIEERFGPDVEVFLDVLDARWLITLEQSPSMLNGYTLRILLDDDPKFGADFYEFKIWAKGNPVPIPGTFFLLGFSMFGLLALKRKCC